MRHRFLHITTLAILTSLTAACSTGQPEHLVDSAPPKKSAAAKSEEQQADALAAQAAEQAEQLNQALAQRQTKRRSTEIQWIEPAAADTTKKVVAPAKTPTVSPPTVATAVATPTTQPAATTNAEREAMLGRLLQQIRTSQDPAMAKAMSAAALSLLDPNHQMDPASLAGLTGSQREQVQRFQQTVTLVARQISSGKAGSADDIIEQLGQAMGEQPLHMRTVQLCKKVSSYGVYENFETSNFLAGREQAMIVYTELEHFRSVKSATSNFQVKLAQEITLYNESDGLAVWRQPVSEIVDESRNRRRDFFVVQLIRLPSRLTVGKYRLKVRITDTNGSSSDESNVSLQIVADQAMVSNTPAR